MSMGGRLQQGSWAEWVSPSYQLSQPCPHPTTPQTQGGAHKPGTKPRPPFPGAPSVPRVRVRGHRTQARQRHFLRPHSHSPQGCRCRWGKSRSRLLAGSDPCPGLTRSLRMFLSSEVTPEQEVTPSHCLPVCWTHSQQASLRAQPCPLRGIRAQGQDILQPLPPASQGRPCGSEAGTLPRKTARRCLRGGRRTTQRGAGVPGQL